MVIGGAAMQVIEVTVLVMIRELLRVVDLAVTVADVRGVGGVMRGEAPDDEQEQRHRAGDATRRARSLLQSGCTWHGSNLSLGDARCQAAGFRARPRARARARLTCTVHESVYVRSAGGRDHHRIAAGIRWALLGDERARAARCLAIDGALRRLARE